MSAANTRAGKTAKRAEVRELPSATPAGEGIPGTNTASAEKADAEGAAGAAPIAEAEARGARQEPAPPAAGTIDTATETATADRAAKAEAVTPAGGNVDELLAGAIDAPRLRPANMAEALADAVSDGLVSHINVRSVSEPGFRRAGRFWPSGAGETVIAENFSRDQIVALATERNLVVTPIPREQVQ